MQHAFWFTRGPGRIKNEQRVFGAHDFGRTIRLNGCDEVVVPVITPFRPGDIAARCPDNYDGIDMFFFKARDRGIHICLERYAFSAAKTLVCGDDEI